MSATTTPLPSQFVCGTAGSPDVYYLSAGTRRLIPDSQTAFFLLAGQTVRTLSGADMAAIPLGPGMPTRKDGSLLTQKYPFPPPSIVLYFMAQGQRRRIPDLGTELVFAHSGSPFLQVDAADLVAIPEGPSLPTRIDGTLYQGAGKPFAYVIENGLKLAFPDATTLRDAGHDFKALLPIAGDDLSLIPDGTAFTSTSKFLSPPASQVPLVLLPVRLETRIQKMPDQTSELWLRIYPDNVHVNSFEPMLTVEEQGARSNYLALPGADVETRRAAFAALARQFGSERAAWICSADVPAAAKKTDWTLAPFTNVLPERWIVIGYQGQGPGQRLATGNLIADPLHLGPVLDDKGNINSDETRWIADFETAIQVGMAFRIPLTGDGARGFTRLVVLGLKSGLSAQDAAARLADLLEAHHYTDGLELLASNAPTNNSDDAPSGFASKDQDYANLFAAEQGPSLCPARPAADGDRLARALNIPPQTLSHVRGADGAQDEQASAMNTVLWPATWGYYLGQVVTGAVAHPDVILPAAREHFANHVRSQGHFRSLRIGRQPYGILPVCASALWQPLEGRALDAPLYRLLSQLRLIWQQYTSFVSRIPNAVDPETAMVSLLGMTPSTSSTVARGVIGPEYSFAYWNFVQRNLRNEWWTDLAGRVRPDSSPVASAMANTRLAKATYLAWHHALSDVIVPLDPPGAADAFITSLAAMGWQALQAALPEPAPMLFLLLRHAALREYLDTALDLLTAANAAQSSERLEAEMVGFAGTTLRPTAWDILQRGLPGRGAVGAVLDSSKNDPALPSFAAYWTALSELARYSAADLDAATRGVFDLSSYRLDAWISSLAHYRLDQTRTADPSGGIVLGAYGWLENVGNWPDEVPTSGYVHAPSLNQATTTAILRSGYLTHQGGAQKPFEIDLSSARVRLALHLLDGIREGQQLGALLGYRLERTLQDLALKEPGLYDLIDKLRSIAPMDGASQLDVVDGLALFHMASDPSSNARAEWSSGLSTTLQSALSTGLAMLSDALDSVADLTLTESVHQLIRGNTLRAGATLDNIARGDAPPPEIDFVKTPRSGTALTYRLMTIASGEGAPGWTVTPRARAEPRLNGWAATLLGDPSLVRVRARFVGADGSTLLSVEIGLNQLALAPIDLLSFAETAGIAGELADRIRQVVLEIRPATVPVGASVEIVSERDAAWSSQTVGLSEWLGLLNAVSRLIAAARPIEPADLVAQNDTPGTIDIAELKTRADGAENDLRAVLGALGSTTAHDEAALQQALMSAAAYGVVGAIPSIDPSLWPTQITAASAEVQARTLALDKLAASFDRSKASPESSRDHDVARLRVVFGTSFVVLPTLAESVASGFPQLWANSTSLQSGDTLAAVRWMQRASRVRDAVGHMDTAIMFAEALAGRTLLQLAVAQLPAVANDKWVALEGSTASSPNTLSLVAFAPMPLSPGAAIAGLMVDEWLEVWPSTDQTTGVTFQYSDPIARAPQAILLAVRPDDFPEWTLEAFEGSVLEALDLAKIRGADPDVLFGEAPPVPIDANVKAFQSISNALIFVLDTAGNLWLKHAPFDADPPVREQVDANVSAFQALSDLEVVVLGTDGRLWLEHGPFGSVPPARDQIDAGQPTLPVPVIPITPPPTTVVPDVSNPGDDISPAEAELALKGAGLKWRFVGVLQPPCKAWHQSVPAGTAVPLGTLVIVSFQKALINRQ